MDVIDTHLKVDKVVVEDEMNDLSKKIIDEILKELLKTKKSFKYAVSCFLQQKNGSALNLGCKYLKIKRRCKLCRRYFRRMCNLILS